MDSATLKSVSSYFAIYIVCMVAVYMLLTLDGFNLETNLSATFACFNNIGPGLAAVGPAANYFAYNPLSKVVLSLAMLLGRLEIFPLLLTLSPATWVKR